MSPETASALRATAYQLRDEADRAARNAKRLHEEADAHEARAQGLFNAAAVIVGALAEADV